MATTITTKGILTINGKQVEDTFNGLKRASGQLERELKKLTPGTQEFIDKSAQLKEVNKRFDEVKQQINETKKASKELNTETQSLGGTFTGLKGKLTDSFASLLAGEVSFKSLGTTIKVFAAEAWASIGSIPIIGWIAAIAAGVGLGMREVFKYNEEVWQNAKLIQNKFGDLAADEDKLRVKLQATSDTYGVSVQRLIDTVDSISSAGMSTELEAMDAIMKGLGTTDNIDDFLAKMDGMASKARQTGITLNEALNLSKVLQETAISADTIFAAMEKSANRFQQGVDGNKAMIEAFGEEYTKNLTDKVLKGEYSTVQALEAVRKKSEEVGLSTGKQADLGKELFGKLAANAGAYEEILRLVHAAHDDQFADLTEIQQEVNAQADAYYKMMQAKDDALKSDSVLAFKKEFELAKVKIATLWYQLIGVFGQADRAIQVSAGYVRGLFLGIPKAASTAFSGTLSALKVMVDGFMSGGKAISLFFKGEFEEAATEFGKFTATVPRLMLDLKSTMKGMGGSLLDSGADEAKAYAAKFDAQKKFLAETARAEEKAAADAAKRQVDENPLDGGKKAGKKKEKADKSAADRKKELDQMVKDEDDAHKRLLAMQEGYQNAKTKLIDDEFRQEMQKEADRRNQEERKSLTEIAELETKKYKTKSATAKAEYQKAIDTLHDIEILNEETHQMNMLAIQQKWDAKLFEEFVKAEQRRIEEGRRLDEDAINDISTMEEAELALSQMKYLKLTDQELRGIRTLEDAKRALREDADRKMLEASLASLEKQKALLEEALKGMSGEAAEKLKADLEVLYARITAVKGAMKGGKESDAKKVKEDGDAAKDAVDVLGFSVKDWEDAFKNLDTTEGKLRAVGMAFQALSNAGQMFADLTRSLADKDMRKFEAVQNKKKESLLNQLNTGYITNEQYNKEIQKMEAETANKKAEMEYKQAKADKVARMFAIVGNTAMGIASALAAPFPINTWLPWIVGAMGAVQLGIVAAQPLPERPSFAGGGFTGSGFGDPDNTGFRPAGIVHQNEWVAPEWMTENPRTAKVIDYLESIRLGKTTPMAEGGFVQDTAQSSASVLSPTAENAGNSELMPVLYRLGNFLEYLITKGVYIEKNPKNGKEAKEMIDMWDELKNKNKH